MKSLFLLLLALICFIGVQAQPQGKAWVLDSAETAQLYPDIASLRTSGKKDKSSNVMRSVHIKKDIKDTTYEIHILYIVHGKDTIDKEVWAHKYPAGEIIWVNEEENIVFLSGWADRMISYYGRSEFVDPKYVVLELRRIIQKLKG